MKKIINILTLKDRKQKDIALNVLVYTVSSLCLLVLLSLLFFVFRNGISRLSWRLVTTDYYESVYITKLEEEEGFKLNGFEDPQIEGAYFSAVWGIALKDSENLVGEKTIEVVYIASLSPFHNMIDISNNKTIRIEQGFFISKIILTNDSGGYIASLSRNGANQMILDLNASIMITDMLSFQGGGGIRGSLITTLYLIFLTLIIVLPLGIAGAIYINEYASRKTANILRSMIDMTSGIPSIIFGLVGAIIFIPFMNNIINSNGGSIASGALTLSIILLPIVIRTTEESLKIIPQKHKDASLALGASKTQTIFKIVIPNSINGILTATLLSIGRVIGESAALIFAVGTVIKDVVRVNESSTSLSVHIWTLMAGENPNFETACAIAIIILIVVLILNIIVKIISQKMNKMKEAI